MNDPRDEDGEVRIQRREADDWRTSRRDEVEPNAPPGRGRFRDEEDDYDDYAPNDPRNKVRGPGLAMVIVGWIGLLLSLAFAGLFVYLGFTFPPPPGGQQGGPPLPLILGVVYPAFGLVSAAANVVVILGGHRMRQCRSWGLALTAAILCIASFMLFGPCSVFSVGFGIWAMVVLLSADVQREFDRVARSGARGTEGR